MSASRSAFFAESDVGFLRGGEVGFEAQKGLVSDAFDASDLLRIFELGVFFAIVEDALCFFSSDAREQRQLFESGGVQVDDAFDGRLSATCVGRRGHQKAELKQSDGREEESGFGVHGFHGKNSFGVVRAILPVVLGLLDDLGWL